MRIALTHREIVKKQAGMFAKAVGAEGVESGGSHGLWFR
jgi:hypothetical protein